MLCAGAHEQPEGRSPVRVTKSPPLNNHCGRPCAGRFDIARPARGPALAAGAARPGSVAVRGRPSHTKGYRDFVWQVCHTKSTLLYGWGGSGAPSWCASGLPPSRPRRALRSPCPARPSPFGRLARSGALAPCAGWPPGVFRRLRAAGVRSGTAPQAARSPRTRESGCSERKSAPIRKVVQSLLFHPAAPSAILETAQEQGYMQGFAIPPAKKTEESRPPGRLSPYLDTIGGNLRMLASRKPPIAAQIKGNSLPFSSNCAVFRTKPLAIAGEIWYNDSGKVSSP